MACIHLTWVPIQGAAYKWRWTCARPLPPIPSRLQPPPTHQLGIIFIVRGVLAANFIPSLIEGRSLTLIMIKRLPNISIFRTSFQRASAQVVNFRGCRLPRRCCPQQFAAAYRLHSTLHSSVDDIPDFEYQYIEGVEKLEQYRPGGYHPVLIGDVLSDRYRVVHKLGYGTFSTVWLALDKRRSSYVAVKISTADSYSREANALQAVVDHSSNYDHSGKEMIPVIQDQFEICGPNGCHKCYVTAPASSSVAAANFSRLFKIETARALVSQLILAVAYTHAQGFVHGG